MKTKVKYQILILFAALFLMGCDDELQPTPPPTGVYGQYKYEFVSNNFSVSSDAQEFDLQLKDIDGETLQGWEYLAVMTQELHESEYTTTATIDCKFGEETSTLWVKITNTGTDKIKVKIDPNNTKKSRKFTLMVYNTKKSESLKTKNIMLYSNKITITQKGKE